MIKVFVLTQDERVYLPGAFDRVLERLGERVAAVVVSPVMSTHRGLIRGTLRHLRLFGFSGTLGIARRALAVRLTDLFMPPAIGGPFGSMRAVCNSYGVPFYRVARINGPELQKLLEQHPADLLISISCPQIIGKAIRQHFSKGCINVHSAPLPLYRGLMPTFWALRNNEKETGITVHEIDSKLDNGAILAQRMIPISPDETWDSLIRKTKRAGAHLLAETVLQMEETDVPRKPNPEDCGSYFSFPGPEDRKAFLALGRRFF